MTVRQGDNPVDVHKKLFSISYIAGSAMMTMKFSSLTRSINLSDFISSHQGTIKSACLAYAVFAGTLVAYNLRWKYLGDFLPFTSKRQAKHLPIAKVIAAADDDEDDEKKEKISEKKPIIVLLHGMWHDSSWCLFSEIQSLLKQNGYTSYAIDLLPGERFLPGFTQNEIVTDLESTLLCDSEDDNNEYILVGHSQGGLVAQSLMKNSSSKLKQRIKGIVLMGTYPLGLIPPTSEFMKEPQNMYNHIGYAGICLIGKIINIAYLQHIFLLPSTNPTSTSRLQNYTTKILKAPSDGLITMSHFLLQASTEDKVISTKPTLVVGAQNDIIYYPHLLEKDFDTRFPNASHKVIPRQAHCFMDPIVDDKDKSNDVKHVLMNWVNGIFSSQ